MVSRFKLSNKLYTKHKNKNTYKSSIQTYKPNAINININEEQAELILLHNIIISQILLMMVSKTSKKIIKEKIINLFKQIRNHNKFISKDVKDSELETLFNLQYNKTKDIKAKLDSYLKCQQKLIIDDKHAIKHKTLKKSRHTSRYASRHTSRHKGGFYFKSLEEKGEQPLTGNDLAKLLDEIQQFFYNAQYTTEGQFLQDTNAVLGMLRGDLGQFKGLLQYRIFPKYYSPFPPFIKWNESSPGAGDGIKAAIVQRKYEDIPDYLLAYQSYLRSRDEYLVEKGMKSPSALNKDLYQGFFNKLANSLDQNIQKFQQYRNKAQGNFYPVALTA
jgi:hypothetical protein